MAIKTSWICGAMNVREGVDYEGTTVKNDLAGVGDGF